MGITFIKEVVHHAKRVVQRKRIMSGELSVFLLSLNLGAAGAIYLLGLATPSILQENFHPKSPATAGYYFQAQRKTEKARSPGQLEPILAGEFSKQIWVIGM
jgi:hypothetical protein